MLDKTQNYYYYIYQNQLYKLKKNPPKQARTRTTTSVDRYVLKIVFTVYATR